MSTFYTGRYAKKRTPAHEPLTIQMMHSHCNRMLGPASRCQFFCQTLFQNQRKKNCATPSSPDPNQAAPFNPAYRSVSHTWQTGNRNNLGLPPPRSTLPSQQKRRNRAHQPVTNKTTHCDCNPLSRSAKASQTVVVPNRSPFLPNF